MDPFEPVEEFILAQGPAGGGGFADPLEQESFLQAFFQTELPALWRVRGPPSDQVQESVVGASEVGSGRGPLPVPGLLHQAGPGGILLDVNHGGPEMFVIHGKRTIAGLPEMAGASQTEMERTSVFAM